jgi:hypothetical protein
MPGGPAFGEIIKKYIEAFQITDLWGISPNYAK